MGVVSYSMEVSTSISPVRMFKAFVLDDKLVATILPQAIKSVETVEGDGGPGTIKLVHFGDGGPGTIKLVHFGDASTFNSVKHRVDELDKEKLRYSYTIIEGDALMGALEKITNELEFEVGPDGGCVCKNTSKYYTKESIEIKEEQIKAGKEKAMVMFKAIEAHLLANPDSYN
ncbi:major allergen Pru ar 1-like isoform X1 [Punica granatum]|uniref:Major allergen Pru ar 1-like isoform X1 n=1 Tax=Punica granatum TaxID=22663 RepID=A0A6P8C4L7_PUNGR|nr:major allergen Pru ar 1-like isoform X1 [Punica granatum]